MSFSGDSFTQFRFSEEKEWEMDSITASQVKDFTDLAHYNLRLCLKLTLKMF